MNIHNTVRDGINHFVKTLGDTPTCEYCKQETRFPYKTSGDRVEVYCDKCGKIAYFFQYRRR